MSVSLNRITNIILFILFATILASPPALAGPWDLAGLSEQLGELSTGKAGPFWAGFANVAISLIFVLLIVYLGKLMVMVGVQLTQVFTHDQSASGRRRVRIIFWGVYLVGLLILGSAA